MEPTHSQYKILKNVKSKDRIELSSEHTNLDQHWELVRSGYLKHLLNLRTDNWIFVLTEEGESYLEEMEEIK
jgi:putative NIF3 family GTP cyclohydrolase 1 type 2